MATRNQNRPPKSPVSATSFLFRRSFYLFFAIPLRLVSFFFVSLLKTLQKKDDAATDKRRKIGAGRIGGATSTVRGRQILSSVNPNQEAAGDPTGSESSEVVEFTREEVEALLNEKIKAKKFDTKVSLISL